MKLNNILNISNIDIEKAIMDTIKETRKQLNNLTDDRTCMIYTGYLYMKLMEKRILAYIIDTYDDLKMDYRHQFVIVPIDGKNCYVIDLTYRQFGINPLFEVIYDKGYQLLSKDMYDKYLDNIKCVTKSR